jgi:S-ribosylhomocysteine lyase
MLDGMHKRKIDLADEIFVINKGGYIGSSTKSEIEYAIANNKKVSYLEEPVMQNIGSFEIDHTKLLPGIYVSRKDKVGSETITTFDLRVCKPNIEPAMNTDEIHTIEHLAATFLRNNLLWKDKVIYFGPMGCRTGFYLILAGDFKSEDICTLICECFIFVLTYNGDIPGATEQGCGNYRDMNLPAAKDRARLYLNILMNLSDAQLIYPN